MSPVAIVWLRRDLSVHDHPPLVAALAAHDRVVPVFVLDPVLLKGRFASGPRTAFLLDCLRELDAALRERGSGLVVRHGAPERELPALAEATGARAVHWASDATPYALARDRRVRAALRQAGVEAVPGRAPSSPTSAARARRRADRSPSSRPSSAPGPRSNGGRSTARPAGCRRFPAVSIGASCRASRISA
jgi:deoxyribodipyrimidine photolyase